MLKEIQLFQACLKTCYQRSLILNCSCCSSFYPCAGEAFKEALSGRNVSVCNDSNGTTHNHCTCALNGVIYHPRDICLLWIDAYLPVFFKYFNQNMFINYYCESRPLSWDKSRLHEPSMDHYYFEQSVPMPRIRNQSCRWYANNFRISFFFIRLSVCSRYTCATG